MGCYSRPRWEPICCLGWAVNGPLQFTHEAESPGNSEKVNLLSFCHGLEEQFLKTFQS